MVNLTKREEADNETERTEDRTMGYTRRWLGNEWLDELNAAREIRVQPVGVCWTFQADGEDGEK